MYFFFFNDTATTEIYTLSLHDALPIYVLLRYKIDGKSVFDPANPATEKVLDRKSTRLNSSHTVISYAVFCLKKKKKNIAIVYETETFMRRRAPYAVAVE